MVNRRYNHTRHTNGEITSEVRGYRVTYPATCNGRLGDIGFVESLGTGGSDFVHFDPTTGCPYGTPLTAVASSRLVLMRRDAQREQRLSRHAEALRAGDIADYREEN